MKDLIARAGSILLAGYGFMGRHYLRVLLENGARPESIFVVDTNSQKLLEVPQGIRTSAEWMDVSLGEFHTAFVTVNTPFHGDVIRSLIIAGVKGVFVEKPLVFNADELSQLSLEAATCRIFTAHLINFSPAVKFLTDLMTAQDLVVLEVRGSWGKNRTFDPRMSAGDLEDESVHMTGLALMLAGLQEEIVKVDMGASLSYLPFVNSSVQRAAHEVDPSIPLQPNSGAMLALRITTGAGIIFCGLTSSFLLPVQTRMMDFVLGTRREREVQYLIRLEFDKEGKDIILTQKAGEKTTPFVRIFDGTSKLRDEVGAFLAAIAGEEEDPRLTGFDKAAFLVRLTKQAAASQAHYVPLIP